MCSGNTVLIVPSTNYTTWPMLSFLWQYFCYGYSYDTVVYIALVGNIPFKQHVFLTLTRSVIIHYPNKDLLIMVMLYFNCCVAFRFHFLLFLFFRKKLHIVAVSQSKRVFPAEVKEAITMSLSNNSCARSFFSSKMPYDRLLINFACKVCTEKYQTSVFYHRPRPYSTCRLSLYEKNSVWYFLYRPRAL